MRQARARRGITRKALARDSGVSERYLAQLEAGEGNISIRRLRDVAAAMSLPVVDLLDDRPAEQALLRELVTGLSPSQLGDAYRILSAALAPGRGDKRAARVALIGLRGAGKSTLGPRLAERLGVKFIELAREIEVESGTSVSEIFSLYGQAAYRRFERRALDRVIETHERVVMTVGGSLVSEPATFDRLLRACHTVWIAASPAEHMARVVAQGDFRPMEGNSEAMADLKQILELRRPLYAQAEARVDTSGKTVEESLRELDRAVERLLRPVLPLDSSAPATPPTLALPRKGGGDS